ncbi:MAG: hypothetical protein CVV53_02230, partial [Spirochaetae bacterium HGW-Spirochaetae-9]
CCVYNADQSRSTNSFLDSICSSGSFDEELANLADLSYSCIEKEKSPSKVIFSRDFAMKSGSSLHSFTIRKAYLFQKYCVSVDIELSNRSQHQVGLRYVSEVNVQPSAAREDVEFFASEGREKVKLASATEGQTLRAEALSIQTIQGKEMLEIRSDKAFQLRVQHIIDKHEIQQHQHLPQGDSEIERSLAKGDLFYQGTRLLFGWDLSLAADTTAAFSLSLHI